MKAIIIQDSDDDDVASNASFNTNVDAVRPESTHRADAAQNSTDPDFFQTIIDEQCGESRREYRSLKADSLRKSTEHLEQGGGADLESSEDVVNIVETSKQGQGRSNRNSRGKQRNLVSQKKWSDEGPDDLWAFPSSPEDNHKTGLMMSRSRRGAGQQHSEASDETPVMYEKESSHKKKRRKLSASRRTLQDVEEMDPLAAAEENDDRWTSETRSRSSMLPPTQPVDGKSSFVVVPKTMTNSQREECQSFPVDSSGHCSVDQGMEYRRNDAPITLPSSSATNVNTPRSTMPCSRSATAARPTQNHEDGEAPTMKPRRKSQSAGELPSSIDPFALPQSGEHIPPQVSRKQKKKQSRMTMVPEDDQADELDMDFGPVVPAQDDEDDEDYGEVVAKPKKPRGRPKKKNDAELPEKPVSPDNSATAKEVPPKESKKKRGRPKKTALKEKLAEEVQPDMPIDHSHEVKKEDEVVLPAHVEDNVAEHALNPKEDDDEQKKETSDVTTKDRLKTDLAPPVGKAVLESKKVFESPSSWNATKPIYRVGLSKRSRIAPLLKVVRK